MANPPGSGVRSCRVEQVDKTGQADLQVPSVDIRPGTHWSNKRAYWISLARLSTGPLIRVWFSLGILAFEDLSNAALSAAKFCRSAIAMILAPVDSITETLEIKVSPEQRYGFGLVRITYLVSDKAKSVFN
jgi:hypothetical protein